MKWMRSTGYDQLGRNTVVITQIAEKKQYRSLINKFQGFMIKLVIFFAVVFLLPLAMLINLLS